MTVNGKDKDASAAAACAPQPTQQLHVCREELYVSGKDPHSLAEFLLDPDPLTGMAGVEAMCHRDRGETWRVTVDLLPLGPAAAWRHRRRLVKEASGAGGALGQGVGEFLGGLGIGQSGAGRGFWAEFSEGAGLPRVGAGGPGRASSRAGGAARSRRDPGQAAAASDERRQLARQIARTDALFSLQLLLRTAAPTKGRAVELMQALRSCFADFAGRSSFQAVGVHLGVAFLGDDLPVRARWFDWRMRSGWFHPARRSVVAAREIVGLMKPPTKKCTADNVVRSGGFVPPSPAGLPNYRHQHGVIPLARVTGREGRQRLAGIYLTDTNFGAVFGMTGTGKSELASNQFLWVAHHARWKHPRTGRLLPIGGLFIDPLGQVLERLPAFLADQADRLLLLDTVTWRQEQPVIGWNPLDMSGCTALDIEPRVKPLLDAYMVANGWKPGTNSRAMSLFGNALISLAQLGLQLPADCQPTIFQLPTLLQDEGWRQAVLPFLSKPVQTFWRRDYASLGGAKGEAAAAASHTVNLLRQSGPIAAMLGQSRNGLDLRRAMDEGKLIIACTAAAGEFETSLVSAILVLSLFRAAKSRVNIPQLERRPFAVWLDELHQYDDGRAVPGMFAEVRKLLRGPVCVLDQRPLKLKPETFGAIATNSSYVITASVGEDEARWISEQWSKQVTPETIQQLAMGERQPDGSRLFEYIARVMLNGRRTLPFRIRGVSAEELFADWHAPDRAEETIQRVNQAAGRRLPSEVIADLDTLDARILTALTGSPRGQRGTTARGGSRKGRARPGGAGRNAAGDLFDQAYVVSDDDERDNDGGAA